MANRRRNSGEIELENQVIQSCLVDSTTDLLPEAQTTQVSQIPCPTNLFPTGRRSLRNELNALFHEPIRAAPADIALPYPPAEPDHENFLPRRT